MPVLSLFILNAFAAWMYRSAAVWYLSSLPLLKKLKPPPALCSVFSACARGTCQRAVAHAALVRGWRGVAGEPTFWIRLRGSSAIIAVSVCDVAWKGLRVDDCRESRVASSVSDG